MRAVYSTAHHASMDPYAPHVKPEPDLAALLHAVLDGDSLDRLVR